LRTETISQNESGPGVCGGSLFQGDQALQNAQIGLLGVEDLVLSLELRPLVERSTEGNRRIGGKERWRARQQSADQVLFALLEIGRMLPKATMGSL
jgi:hypothetical protein